MIRDAVDGLTLTRRASSSRPSRSVRRNYNNRAATTAGIDPGCVRARGIIVYPLVTGVNRPRMRAGARGPIL
ncbi:MAG: hypothetical protein B5766_00110 [Candidatus Lumbricidophila eiseniae]|uniref:Uncharacterized protein n=1 Tax=Candidatus Lumbricidiphila eiseniae TaxID=1969409 RepID=A0A2A6FVT6_9MICO|nr:MAG: hypothetical protein B5766_00110 [Candidatus Lumbricidophila eiseniae]